MRLLVGVVVVCGLAAGCSGDPDDALVVHAASSLTDAFVDIEAEFEEANPGVDVQLNLGGSSSLREQILAGAPADVFASANQPNMDAIVEADAAAGEPTTFARNVPQVAVPAGNPGGVAGLEDFADDSLFIGLCAPGVPCGDFAREVLANAGVEPAPDTNEPDVRALLTKIATGELDAGIVYTTDVVAAGGDVEGIDIPAGVNVEAVYPIVRLAGAPNPDAADAFVGFVLSPRGQAILSAHGFAPA